MLKTIATMDSGVIRALLVAAVALVGLILGLFGVDASAFGEKAEAIVDAVLVVLATGGVAWAAYARAYKPTPPITQTAVEETRRLLAAGTLKEGGFARAGLLAALAIALTAALVGAGCTATRAAYQAAEDPEEVAFVVSEHYNALLKEAADLVEAPDTPQSVKGAIKQASQAATPVVLELRGLAEAYKAAIAALDEAEDADSDAEVAAARAKLAAANAKAITAVASFIRALRSARGNQAYLVLPASSWRASNFILRLERMGGAA